MNPGDRVSYTKAWTQMATGGDPFHPLWLRRGTVEGAVPPWLLVRWDGDDKAVPVAPGNVYMLGSWALAAHGDAKGWVGYSIPGEKRSPWESDPHLRRLDKP